MKLLAHPWLAARVQIVLGIILVYASWHKIVEPPDFAKVVYNYHLLPPPAIHLAAVYLPWLELFTGLALFSGPARRGASLLALLLFALFIAALSYNLARGCPTICGCFDTYASGTHLSDAEKFSKMRWEIALDAALFLLALHAFLFSHGAGREAPARA